MKAVTWQGKHNVEVTEVPDPVLLEPTDAIVRVTSTAICGSDLHLYGPLAPFLDRGDILGHEALGIVEEVGPQAGNLQVGDRVVVPFTISCGHCWMCQRGLQSQCETTQVTQQDSGAALFGYTRLYGSVPGGQAEYVRVPQAQYGPVVLPTDGPDERYLYLSDILPTAWQGVRYAGVGEGDTLVVVGLGPVGQLATRCAQVLGVDRVIGLDLVPERLETARAHGVEAVDIRTLSDPAAAIKDLTQGRGADGVVDAVGMEAHGSPVAEGVVKAVSSLPGPIARAATEKAGIDRLAALHLALGAARRGGTVSLSGVYGGAADPMPMMQMFDRQLTIRMGQANVRRWTDELMELVRDGNAILDVETLATHRLPLDQAAEAYRMFQTKSDGCLKVVLQP
ncbi:glutathione-dependent formaldehyde dehydrogenase [Enemella evansiae]|uniref:zinc-dependent alcohol dehydrogenase n=1 Tax=Enemella evansiae TaxID=2016499 RepID=UPI000B9643C5|nr:zinc-dependent alcohol dehydrogenase [Enemella evansiae]OYN95455.1 glutathione-dependent formaldehyde dehydrogenase [Enemella evansiae]OYO01691.1 glutathione-dependent formaldehyde dehydrogenase [Enemella evansiae]